MHYSILHKIKDLTYKTQKVIMKPTAFYNKFIDKELDKYVSFEFEKICRDYLKRRYSETIDEISLYWYNDRNKKIDIEIDIMMRESSQLYAYECKWTNSPIGKAIIEEMNQKVDMFEDVTIGFFSKAEYEDDGQHCYVVDDLFNL